MVLSWRVALGLCSWAGDMFAMVASRRWEGEGRKGRAGRGERRSLGEGEARQRATALKGFSRSIDRRRGTRHGDSRVSCGRDEGLTRARGPIGRGQTDGQWEKGGPGEESRAGWSLVAGLRLRRSNSSGPKKKKIERPLAMDRTDAGEAALAGAGMRQGSKGGLGAGRRHRSRSEQAGAWAWRMPCRRAAGRPVHVLGCACCPAATT